MEMSGEATTKVTGEVRKKKKGVEGGVEKGTIFFFEDKFLQGWIRLAGENTAQFYRISVRRGVRHNLMEVGKKQRASPQTTLSFSISSSLFTIL